MKLSKKQQLDLKSVLYFYNNGSEPTEDDIKSYFAWSDRGEKDFLTLKTQGAERIKYGKQYRDLQVTSYKEDWGHYITAVDFVLEEEKWFCEWLSNVLKKPGIMTTWRLFHEKDDLDENDWILLDPLVKLSGYVRKS